MYNYSQQRLKVMINLNFIMSSQVIGFLMAESKICINLLYKSV